MDPAVRPRVPVLLLAALVLSVPARADDFLVPVRSVRARLTLADPESGPLVGRFLEVRGDTLTIVRGREALDVPFPEIERLEVGRGFHRATAQGALIGLLFGCGTGALIGASSDDSEWQGLSAAFGGILGGAAGTLSGALVGSAFVGEKWESVPPGAVRVGPEGDVWIPAPRGLPVRVRAPLWGKGRWSGTARGRTADSLLIVREGREAWIPSRLITRVETTWSKESRGTWGAVIGFAAGFAAGVIIHGASQEGGAVSTGAGVGLAGAAAGALVGGLIRVPRWEEIPLDPPPLEPWPEATPAPPR